MRLFSDSFVLGQLDLVCGLACSQMRFLADIKRILGLDPWPSHYRELIGQVEARVRTEAPGTWICAMQNYYLPQGGEESIWVVLRCPSGEAIRERRCFSRKEFEARRTLESSEVEALKETLTALGVFHLDHSRNPARSEWACAIAVSNGKESHAIQTLNPTDPHLRLIRFILNIVQPPDSGR